MSGIHNARHIDECSRQRGASQTADEGLVERWDGSAVRQRSGEPAIGPDARIGQLDQRDAIEAIEPVQTSGRAVRRDALGPSEKRRCHLTLVAVGPPRRTKDTRVYLVEQATPKTTEELELADASGVRLAGQEGSMMGSGKCYHDRVRRIRHTSAVCGDSPESEARLGEIHPLLWLVYTERSEWSGLFGEIHALLWLGGTEAWGAVRLRLTMDEMDRCSCQGSATSLIM